jgi:DNA-binding IclR family transcriptional regulator
MLKRRVLEIFAANSRFMTPDEIRNCLQNNYQRSTVYSYLSRLCRQGLLERAQGWSRVSLSNDFMWNGAVEIFSVAENFGVLEIWEIGQTVG